MNIFKIRSFAKMFVNKLLFNIAIISGFNWRYTILTNINLNLII